MFDPKSPLQTDPLVTGKDEYRWAESAEPDTYYCWAQPVSEAVQFHATLSPQVIEIGHGVDLVVYRGAMKQELLYRLKFREGKPPRLLPRPNPYCLFWSYGDEGGASASLRYHFKDRFVTVHEWTDKDSFLAVLRQHHYRPNDQLFWSR